MNEVRFLGSFSGHPRRLYIYVVSKYHETIRECDFPIMRCITNNYSPYDSEIFLENARRLLVVAGTTQPNFAISGPIDSAVFLHHVSDGTRRLTLSCWHTATLSPAVIAFLELLPLRSPRSLLGGSIRSRMLFRQPPLHPNHIHRRRHLAGQPRHLPRL